MKYADWLTKEQAAQMLGVSERTVMRLADDKKIQQRLRPRPGGSPLAVFNPQDVQRVASERAAAQNMPFVLPAESDAPVASTALTTPSKSGVPAALRHHPLRSGTALTELLSRAGVIPQSESLEHRDILSVAEVRRLKGWSAEFLEQLAREGKLQFRRVVGRRGRMIRRRDLEGLRDVDLPLWKGPRLAESDRVTSRLKRPPQLIDPVTR